MLFLSQYVHKVGKSTWWCTLKETTNTSNKTKFYCDKTKLREIPKAKNLSLVRLLKTPKMSKVCITCQSDKALSEFETRSDTQQKRNQCKQCRSNYVKNYKSKRTTGEIKKKEVEVYDGGYKECKQCHIKKLLNEFPKRDTKHGYRHECLQCKQQNLNIYYQNVYNEKRRNRKQEDVKYKLLNNHRNYIYKMLTRFKNKRGSSMSYVGCTLEQLKQWLEFQFDSQMNWNNYGTLWTIDHVLPLSIFDLTEKSAQSIAFNWKNMRPCTDNFSKGNKLRPYEYFNTMISAHRFIQNNKLNQIEYQGIRESLCWLREKLRYGNKLIDDVIVNKIITEMGNPQPSS